MSKTYDNTPLGKFGAKDLDSRRKWRKVQTVTNMYWERFTREYLSKLTTRSKWFKDSNDSTIRVGDLVLVMDDNVSRGNWPLARVVEVYVGKDGIIRTTLLKTAKGQLVRPVRRLCILENVRS